MQNKIEQLASDFENEAGPFSRDIFPEKRLVDQLGGECKVEYLSLFCNLDYNRQVDRLVENIVELQERRGWDWFHPPYVTGLTESEMQKVFTKIGFRYPNRDAAAWRDNCIKITNTFNGSWYTLLEAAQFHAPTLVKLLRDHQFMIIKGDKLAPFHARVMHDFVHELDDVWSLDIPVDTHIRRLSKDLFENDDLDDDEIRFLWKLLGEKYDISPHLVDGALWQIGYSWHDWGEDYWEEL